MPGRINRVTVGAVESFGNFVIDSITGCGKITLFTLKFFYWILKPPYRWDLLMQQFYFVGNKSLFIICLAGSFTGMVMAYQTYYGFRMIAVDSLVGSVVALTLARELAPVLGGLIVAGRAGSAMAAEIGTMKVTEQVDALEVMGIDSYQYLVVPRVIAATIVLPMLTMIFSLVGNIGSWFIGTQALLIDETLYFAKLSAFVMLTDILQGAIKSLFFGFIIAIIGTYFGLEVRKGAEGVGKGTNQAVVWGMIMVLISDYFLTSFLVRVL